MVRGKKKEKEEYLNGNLNKISNFPKPCPLLTSLCKVVDIWLTNKIEKELSKNMNIRWKEYLCVLWSYRLRFMKWRTEKWLYGIFKECKFVIDERMYVEKEVVYVWFNVVNRRRYVGETGCDLCTRMKQHIREMKVDKFKKVYKGFRKLNLSD